MGHRGQEHASIQADSHKPSMQTQLLGRDIVRYEKKTALFWEMNLRRNQDPKTNQDNA